MKIRTSFVSNSSSCSFVLDKNDMTEKQIKEFQGVCPEVEQDGEICIYESIRHFYGTLSVHDKLIPAFLKKHSLKADMAM